MHEILYARWKIHAGNMKNVSYDCINKCTILHHLQSENRNISIGI